MSIWQYVQTAFANRPAALGGPRISKEQEAAEIARIDQLAADAAAAEEAERADLECLDAQAAVDRWGAAGAELPDEPDFWIGLQPGYDSDPAKRAAELGLPPSRISREEAEELAAEQEAGA
jgi:hypothetical protein